MIENSPVVDKDEYLKLNKSSVSNTHSSRKFYIKRINMIEISQKNS